MKLSNVVFRSCLAIVIAASLCLNGCASSYKKAPDSCNSTLDSPISRFCQATEGALWRGAKPDKVGAAWLIENEVRTIVNLELLHDDLPVFGLVHTKTAKVLKIGYFRVKDWEPLPVLAPSVEDEHVVHFLAIASQQANQPVYVHCRSGQNRTGIMVAAFRIVIEGRQDTEAVVEEMRAYQGVWSDTDAKYLRGLALRRSTILQKVKERISRLEKPTQIICQVSKCTVDL